MNEVNDDFVDILERRRRTSDILWVSRHWEVVRANNQPYKFEPSMIKSIVLNCYKLQKTLAEVSKRNQVLVDALSIVVTKMVNEIGYDRSVSTLRWLGYIVTKILKKLNSSLYLNEAKYLQIRSEMGRNPVLLVPTHRSYCDFILLSYIFFTYNVDIPRIAAGMDFHSMKFMGNVLRKACAFFMRRSFAHDEVYSAVFSEYVKTLITHGDAAVEFYIEGTRSRTGKSLMPKYGFLSMALRPFFIALVPDVTILPVNISYDRVLEEVLFAYELLGVPKPKESTRGFFKALSVLNEKYNDIYIQFGDTFSVKEFFGDKIDRSIHGIGSVQLQELTPDEIKQIIRLAHTIVRKQKRLTVLSCFNLIALVLNNNYLTDVHPPTIDKVSEEVEWLFSVLKVITPEKSMSAISVVTKGLVVSHLTIHKSLVFVNQKEEVQLCRIHTPNKVIDPSVLKGHNLTNKTMDSAIPLLILQYYSNPCSSFLINVCLIDVIVWSTSEVNITIDELLSEFKFLCSVLSYEFVYHPNFVEEDFQESLNHSQSLKILRIEDQSRVIKGENEKFHSYSKSILSSFLPGYLTMLDNLLRFDDTKLNEKVVVKNCQRIVESKLETGTITHPANLSLDLLNNAFQSFVAMDIVTKIRGEKETHYYAKHNEIRETRNKLAKYNMCSRLNPNFTEHFSNQVKTNL